MSYLDSPLFQDLESPSINVRSLVRVKVNASLNAHDSRLKKSEIVTFSFWPSSERNVEV
jgi:hypothetical protein